MLAEPDENGKRRINNREYVAIQTIAALQQGFANHVGQLRDRARLVPNAWRDLKCAEVLIQKSVEQITNETFTDSDMQRMKAELDNTYYSVYVLGAGGHNTHGKDAVVYVHEEAYIRMINRAMAMECIICDKDCKSARRCRLFRDIEDIMPHRIDDGEDGLCKFAGADHLLIKE